MLKGNILFQVFAYGQVLKKAVVIPEERFEQRRDSAVYTLGPMGELLPRFEIEIPNRKENDTC